MIEQKYLFADNMDAMTALLAEANKDGWRANVPMTCSYLPDINHHTQEILHYIPQYNQIVDRLQPVNLGHV